MWGVKGIGNATRPGVLNPRYGELAVSESSVVSAPWRERCRLQSSWILEMRVNSARTK